MVCHFPIAHTGCGGGLGASEVFSDDLLVEEGVIELHEDFLLDEIPADFTPGHFWGTDDEFDRYFELNVTGLALKCCQEEGVVPITDVPEAPIPAAVLGAWDVNRASFVQAAALAVQSIDIALPAFSVLNSHDILEVREKLSSQLRPFRAAMLSLAPKVRAGMEADTPIQTLYQEAKYIVETEVLPTLVEMKNRLELERGTFWRKLTQKVVSRLPHIALNWATKGSLSSVIDTVSLGKEIAMGKIDHDHVISSLLNKGGLGYLLAVSELNKGDC